MARGISDVSGVVRIPRQSLGTCDYDASVSVLCVVRIRCPGDIERAEHIGVLLLALSGDIELPSVKGGGQAIAFSFTGPTLLVRQ